MPYIKEISRIIIIIIIIIIMLYYGQVCGPGSVVGTATGYRLDDPGIESRWGRDFPL